MTAPDGETVTFTESCFAHGPVEAWMNNIENDMFVSLYIISTQALENYPEDGTQRQDWLFEYAAQSILVID